MIPVRQRIPQHQPVLKQRFEIQFENVNAFENVTCIVREHRRTFQEALPRDTPTLYGTISACAQKTRQRLIRNNERLAPVCLRVTVTPLKEIPR